MSEATRFLPVSRRLLGRLFLLGLLCMLIASAVQSVFIYQKEKRQFAQLIDQLAETHVPMLRVALWDIETDALRGQMRQIAAMPEIASATLHAATGLDLQEGELLTQRSADAVLLIEPPPEGSSVLGELHIFYQQKRLNQAILAAVGQRFLELLIFTLLVFIVTLRVVQRDIGLPLRHIARYVSELTPQRHPPALNLDRPARDWFDEMDLVSQGFDTLRDGMNHYAVRHEQALSALSAERDSLDRRVAERTGELAFLNGYLQLVSDTVLRFMNIHHAQYPDTLCQTLAQIGDYLGLDGCCLIERPAGQSTVVRLAWFTNDDWLWLEQVFHQSGLPAENGWVVDESLGLGTVLVRSGRREGDFTFAVRCQQRQALDRARLDLLESTGPWLLSLLQSWGHAQELDRTRRELLQLSHSDHLTGLANRRHFDRYKLEEARRVLRQEKPLALLMIDVDHFKAFNDLYGHTRGDECLVALAQQLSKHFRRAGELPARLGGEEFAVLLPGYSQQQAHQAASDLCRAIVRLKIAHADAALSVVSVSIGCAWWRGGRGDANIAGLVDGLAECADRALYAAKRQGRNQAVSVEYQYSAAGNDPDSVYDAGDIT